MWSVASMQLVENRSSPRVRVSRLRIGLCDVDLTLDGNISTGGVGFEVDRDHRVHVGDPIAVSIDLPELEEPLALSATVCHVHRRSESDRHYVGARFRETDALVENPLFRFVEESALLDQAAHS
jgi:hypothetical protein